MSRQPTLFGIPQGNITWNPDFKASLDDKNLWTASVTFTCRLADLTSLLPSLGSPCQENGFTFMVLNGLEVANNEGGTATVTCKYTGTVSPDYTFDDDDTIPYTTSINISTSEDPIETLPKYSTDEGSLTTRQKYVVQQFKAGRYKINETNEDGTIKSLITRVDDRNIGIEPVANGSLFQQLLGKINSGIVSYLVPKPIYRYNYTQNRPPTSSQLNSVGKRGTPPKAPAVSGGRTWLLIGINYDYNGSTYNISQEWMLSDEAGWDTEIYKSASV